MEDQRTEWKESWKDEYLKTICAFANTEGGVMTIGVDDRGNIIGIDKPEKLLKQLPDKIRNKLGIVPFVKLESAQPPYTISITVQKAPTSVTLDGKLYVRSGSTTQMISGRELELFMMERAGDSWTEVPVPDVSVSDLLPEAIGELKRLGKNAQRLSDEESKLDSVDFLDKMGFIKSGMLNRAAVLLFHPNPSEVLGPVSLKIGMFEDSDLLFMDEFTGPLIFTPNGAVKMLMTKYSIKPVGYEGIFRTESNPYPEPAIREAVLNAIVHNDYSSHVPIQIKVYREGLTIYNEGDLPRGWTLAKLMGHHKSIPRNPSLAEAFYRAGMIESFGRGIGKIISQFKGRDECLPVFDLDAGFSITFKNEIFFEIAKIEDCSPEDVIKSYLKINKSATYDDILNLTKLSKRHVYRIVNAMVDEGTLTKERQDRLVVVRLSENAE